MNFEKWGEENFIEFISKEFPVDRNIIGIGDDCAVIPIEEGKAWLITTDALVEGVHFLKNEISAKDLGYKTVVVNVSDIYAMGGMPNYAFLTIALPKTLECIWMQQFIKGFKEACKKWNILLLGGDTVGSKRDIFINLTLIGLGDQNKIKYRNQAQSGDVICVSGFLGQSAGGLKALQTKTPRSLPVNHLIHTHFRPELLIEEGSWLASHSEVHAMMDISDGLNCDLKKLLKKSDKGAVVDIDQIPISPQLLEVSITQEWDALELALVGGEDYCLLLTVCSDAFNALQKSFQKQFQRSLFAIGNINDSSNELIYQRKGESIPINYTSYNHFH